MKTWVQNSSEVQDGLDLRAYPPLRKEGNENGGGDTGYTISARNPIVFTEVGLPRVLGITQNGPKRGIGLIRGRGRDT